MTEDKLRSVLAVCGVSSPILRGSNLMACCPFHQERNPSWGISVNAPHVHGCFTCGAKGTIVDLIVHATGQTYTKAAQLAETALNRRKDDLSLERSAPETDEQKLEESIELLVPSVLAYRYLCARRKVSPELYRKLSIRYDYARQRVVFLWWHERKLVGATGRSVLPDDPVKTLPYSGTFKSRYLYFPLPPKPGAPLALVEGEIDAIKTKQAVPEYNVGALGFGTFTDAQADIVKKLSPRFVVSAFDDDAAGQRITTIASRKIDKLGMRFRAVDWSTFSAEGKSDPGAMPTPALRRLILTSKSELGL